MFQLDPDTVYIIKIALSFALAGVLFYGFVLIVSTLTGVNDSLEAQYDLHPSRRQLLEGDLDHVDDALNQN